MAKNFFPVLFVSFLFLAITGCQSTKNASDQSGKTLFKPVLISNVPEVRPDWVDMVPSSDASIYFVGSSSGAATESDAREQARSNAFSQIVSYYGNVIKSTATGKKTVRTLSDSDVETYIETENLISTFAERYISQILAENYYTELWQNTPDATIFQVWVLCSVPKSKVEEEINTFADDVSERFSALLPENQRYRFVSLIGAVEAYLDVYKAINENPIYQAVAYTKTESGKVSLDDYTLQQAKRLIQDCVVERIDYQERVDKGSAMKVVAHLNSADYKKTTGISVLAEVSKDGMTISSGLYGTNDNNDVEIIIDTDNLDYGNYVIQLQLFSDSFEELGTVYAQNCSVSFKIDYIHAGIRFDYSGCVTENSDVENKIKNALQEQLNNFGVPLVLDETISNNSGWKFVVQIDGTKLNSAADVQKIKIKETVLLQQNGITKCKTTEFSATGLSKIEASSISSANDQCVQKLVESTDFFTSILDATGAKK